MRLFLLIVGLLGSLTINAQIASTTQFGVIKIGSNVSVDANGFLNATATGTASATTIQTLRNSWPITVVSNPTVANVQAAVNAAASTGAHIKVGTTWASLNVSSALTITNKPNLWLDFQGYVTWIRADDFKVIEVFGDMTNSRISGGSFISTFAGGGGEAVVATWETAKLINYEFDHNSISNPNGDFNAYSQVHFSAGNAGGSATSNNIWIHHNRIGPSGRIGMELKSQEKNITNGTYTARVTNVLINHNFFQDLGRQSNNGHGMAISVDGTFDGVIQDSNRVYDAKDKTLEVVNCKNAKVTRNFVRNSKSPNVVGVSTSAGDTPATYTLLVEGNDIETTGTPYSHFDAKDLTFLKNRGINSSAIYPSMTYGIYLVRVIGGKIESSELRTAGVNCVTFDNSSGITASNNTFSNEFNPRQLQVVFFYGSNTTGNTVLNNRFAKMPGAYRADQPYINEGSGASGNAYSSNDIITNGTVRQPYSADGVNGIVLLLTGQSTNPYDIVDESPRPKQILRNGNVSVSTAQFKYGSSSLYFDGNSSLIIPKSPDFDFGTGDFTFEGWIYPTVSPTGYPGLVSRQTASNVSWTWGLLKDNSALDFNIVNNANSYTGPGPTAGGSMSLNTWHHVAIVSSGGSRRQYMDGVQVATTNTVTTMELNTVGQNLVIGAQGDGDASNGTFFKGYMHLRLTKGIGRYTANFTPPTSF